MSGWCATTHRRKATLLHPNHYVKVVKNWQIAKYLVHFF